MLCIRAVAAAVTEHVSADNSNRKHTGDGNGNGEWQDEEVDGKI